MKFACEICCEVFGHCQPIDETNFSCLFRQIRIVPRRMQSPLETEATDNGPRTFSTDTFCVRSVLDFHAVTCIFSTPFFLSPNRPPTFFFAPFVQGFVFSIRGHYGLVLYKAEQFDDFEPTVSNRKNLKLLLASVDIRLDLKPTIRILQRRNIKCLQSTVCPELIRDISYRCSTQNNIQ